MAKRTVKVEITEVKKTDATIAGGNIGKNVKPGTSLGREGGDVDVKMEKVEGGVFEIAGGDVVSFSQFAEPLDNLTRLLSENLSQQDEVDDLKEIVVELKEQSKKPEAERNSSKIKRLLDNISTYIGLATLAAGQAEQAQTLFTNIKHMLGWG